MSSTKDNLIKLAAEILTSQKRISVDPDDWNIPKSVPQYFMRILFRRIAALDKALVDWAVEIRKIADGKESLSIQGIKELIEYAQSIIILPRSELLALTKFNCDHVIFSGNEEMHCDKNENDLKRGACCNSCWVRRWAKQKLKIKD